METSIPAITNASLILVYSPIVPLMQIVQPYELPSMPRNGPSLSLFIPPFPLRSDQRLHGFVRENTLAFTSNLRNLLIEDRPNLIRPLLSPIHQLPRLIRNGTPRHTRSRGPRSNGMTSATCTTSLRLRRILLLTCVAGALLERSLDLGIQVVEDGAVFLVSHLVFGQHFDSRFTGAVDNADFFERGLEHAQTLGNFVVVVAS